MECLSQHSGNDPWGPNLYLYNSTLLVDCVSQKPYEHLAFLSSLMIEQVFFSNKLLTKKIQDGLEMFLG
jgi:hypothetical protein